MSLHEPATALTDFLLAVECAWFAASLRRVASPARVRGWFAVLFGSVALAALAGGAVHGFFPDPQGPANRAFWLITLMSIGVTAAAMLAIAASLVLDEKKTTAIEPAMVLGLAAYAGVVLFVSRDFAVAIVAYLPAALVLMAALARRWAVGRDAGARAGIIGVVLALFGAAGQQAGVGLHPVYFDHNAVYHVVQAVALYLLFRCAVGVCQRR